MTFFACSSFLIRCCWGRHYWWLERIAAGSLAGDLWKGKNMSLDPERIFISPTQVKSGGDRAAAAQCIEKSYCSNKDVIRPVADSIICKMSQGLPSMDSMRVAMRFSSTGFVYNLPSANTATAVGLGSSSAMIMAFVEAAWSSQVQEYRAGRCVKHSPSVRQPYGGRLFTSCGWCRYCYLCSFSCSYEPPTLGQKM